MFENADPLIAGYDQLEAQLASPTTHVSPVLMCRVDRHYATLRSIVETLALYHELAADREAVPELVEQDPTSSEEAGALGAQLEETAARLTWLLTPRDPNDDTDTIFEIESRGSGEESALLVAGLSRMYRRYAGQIDWHLEVLGSQAVDLGGFESATVIVRGTSVDGVGPYGQFKFEGGVHRVQRVPVIETQGRVHTSAAGVLVSPDTKPEELEISKSDPGVDVFHASGPGGQGVSTTDLAVRITYLPTGVVVSCQNERSRLQNRGQAMRLLRFRLTAIREAEAAETASAARRSQVRTVNRPKWIHTYNFPENRFAGHRVSFKAHNLDLVLARTLAPVLNALAEAGLAERLSGPGR